MTVSEMLQRGFEGFQGKTLEDHVRELMDREEVRELTGRYAQRVSRRLSPADLFTDDGAFIVRYPGQSDQEARGREQLEQVFSRITGAPTLNMPAIHNSVVSISGDEAIATSWIELYSKDGEERRFGATGWYEDQLRRENGRWKFVVRTAVQALSPPTPAVEGEDAGHANEK